MRVLHVISGLDPVSGGPLTALVELARAQRAAGLEVSIFSTYRGARPDTAASLAAAGIDVTEVGPTTRPLERHPEIKRSLRRIVPSFDVVHVHALWEEVQHQAARAARAAKVPYVFTPHGMLTSWSLKQGWLKKRAYLALRLRRDLDAASAIHYTTERERDASSALGLKPPSFVEPLGVNVSEFESLPPAGMLRDRWPQLQGQRIVLFLGRIYPGKGLEHLVPALAQAQLPGVSLVVVGPDPRGFRRTIERLVDQHRLRERVIFVGMLRGQERLAALADADLFALPSDHENFGMVVIEALAAGLPVVISEGVALAGEIRAAQVGEVVPVGDVDRLAEALRRWASQPAERCDAVADRARQFVRQRYDWGQIALRWAEHYRRCKSL